MAEVDLAELERYIRIFQENPDSRVFAPLADLYRRLGKLSEAEEISREGIRRHPYYAGGRVALAHVLLDAGSFEEALSESDSVVTYYPDNLLARKILIRVLGALGEMDRAKREFEALKHLAPVVATDPELEKAIQGRIQLAVLPARPEESSGAWQEESLTQTGHDIGPSLQRREKLAILLRRKLVLEAWLEKVSAA